MKKAVLPAAEIENQQRGKSRCKTNDHQDPKYHDANNHNKHNTTKKKLVSSRVFVRIRPMVFDGSGHDQNVPGVAKSLASYTQDTITLNTQYMLSQGSNVYTFPTRVLEPGACIDGRAMLAMIVCISQAPQCGWETWFSMNYGTDLANLCTPVNEAKWYVLERALQSCKEAYYEKATKALDSHERQYAGKCHPNARRWHQRKYVLQKETAERLKLLQVLNGL